MLNEKDKYQNLLTQLHELNRNIVLNENEKVEQITQRIESLEEKIEKSSTNTNNKINDKFFISIIIITLINTLLLLFIFFTFNTEQKDTNKEDELVNKKDIQIEEKVETKEIDIKEKLEKDDKSTEDVLSFNEKSIIAFEEDEEFVEIKPIIRKGTQYNCKDDMNTYKIPYTVEIKGKLYSDKFKFILQENSVTKECTILKEYM